MSATSNRPDPVEAEIERALDPGRFVSDRGCFRFVEGLEPDQRLGHCPPGRARVPAADHGPAAGLDGRRPVRLLPPAGTRVATVFDEAGLAAFINAIRSRFETADQATSASVGPDQPDRDARWRRAETTRWAEVLRPLYAAGGDLGAYVELAERAGLTADDCLTVANLLVTRGDPTQALAWVERGLQVDAD